MKRNNENKLRRKKRGSKKNDSEILRSVLFQRQTV